MKEVPGSLKEELSRVKEELCRVKEELRNARLTLQGSALEQQHSTPSSPNEATHSARMDDVMMGVPATAEDPGGRRPEEQMEIQMQLQSQLKAGRVAATAQATLKTQQRQLGAIVPNAVISDTHEIHHSKSTSFVPARSAAKIATALNPLDRQVKRAEPRRVVPVNPRRPNAPVAALRQRARAAPIICVSSDEEPSGHVALSPPHLMDLDSFEDQGDGFTRSPGERLVILPVEGCRTTIIVSTYNVLLLTAS